VEGREQIKNSKEWINIVILRAREYMNMQIYALVQAKYAKFNVYMHAGLRKRAS